MREFCRELRVSVAPRDTAGASAKLFRAPEWRRKLAGGGAKLNHQDRSKKIVRVPAGTPDRDSQQDQSRSRALSGRWVMSRGFRRLGFAPAPANIPRASGAGGVCQQHPKLLIAEL